MPEVLWIPIGVVALGVLVGAWAGARSSTANAKTGFLIGLYISVMATFPLIAIGLATS